MRKCATFTYLTIKEKYTNIQSFTNSDTFQSEKCILKKKDNLSP